MKKQSVMSIIAVGVFVLGANAGSADAAASSPSVPLSITASVAAKCIVSATTTVAFGAYDPVSTNSATGSDLDGTGAVSVQCTKNSGLSISLDGGLNAGASTQRKMLGGSDFRNYDLFTDSGRSTPWGIGAVSPLLIPVAPSTVARAFTVYGRVPKGQSVGAASFTDTVQATVNF